MAILELIIPDPLSLQNAATGVPHYTLEPTISSLRLTSLVLAALVALSACTQTGPNAQTANSKKTPETAASRPEPVLKGIRENIGKRPTSLAEVRTLGSATADGNRWSLVAFRDGNGVFCIAVDSSHRQGTPACDIELPKAHPINMAMEVTDGKKTLLYGGVRDEVRELYLSDASGSHRQRTYTYPTQPNRWFFILINRLPIKNISAVLSDGRSYSVQPEIVKAANAAAKGQAPPTSSNPPTPIGPKSQ